MEREDRSLYIGEMKQSFEKHVQEKEELLDRIRVEDFPKMRYYLDNGFNLLVYGVGSKFKAMN